MKRGIPALLSAAAGIALLTSIAALVGIQPLTFLSSLLDGSVGNLTALEASAVKAIPLCFTALSVIVAFRGGVWNIGAEGQFLAGAIASCFVSLQLTGGLHNQLLALLAGAAGGGLWAAVAAWLKVRRGAPEVLSTILLNFVAIYLLGFLVNGPMREMRGQYPQSDMLEGSSFLPLLHGQLHAGLFILLLSVVAVGLTLSRTRWGLRLRAIGVNVNAARYSGIHVEREIFRAFVFSGALAGLGGSVELLGVTHRLYERFSSGFGYSGIAVALLAQLSPAAALFSAFFFGALRSAGGELQRSQGLSAGIATLSEGVVIVLLLTFGSARLLKSRETMIERGGHS